MAFSFGGLWANPDWTMMKHQQTQCVSVGYKCKQQDLLYSCVAHPELPSWAHPVQMLMRRSRQLKKLALTWSFKVKSKETLDIIIVIFIIKIMKTGKIFRISTMNSAALWPQSPVKLVAFIKVISWLAASQAAAQDAGWSGTQSDNLQETQVKCH